MALRSQIEAADTGARKEAGHPKHERGMCVSERGWGVACACYCPRCWTAYDPVVHIVDGAAVKARLGRCVCKACACRNK